MTATPHRHGRRRLPAIGRLLDQPAVTEALQRLPRTVVGESLRAELAEARARVNGDGEPAADTAIVERAIARAELAEKPSLRRAINATGVVLHTGLGTAVLSQPALRAVAAAAAAHST